MLFMFMMMPWGVETALHGDTTQMRDFRGGKFGFSEYSEPGSNQLTLDPAKKLGDALFELMQQDQGREFWAEGINSIQITKPLSDNPNIVLWGQSAHTLLNRARPERWHFDRATGVMTKVQTTKVDDDLNVQIYNVLSALHLQRYALPLQRALFFAGGLLGTLMVASGLHIWVKKRPVKTNTVPTARYGIALAKGLNVAFLMGLPAATAAAMWLNRLVPVELEGRALFEIHGFFLFWALTLVYGLARDYDKALAELMSLTGVMLLMLAMFNLHFIYADVDVSYGWLNAPLIVQMVDSSILFTGFVLLYFGFRQLKSQGALDAFKRLSLRKGASS